MTTLATDTFQRADQSGWGTASDGHTWSAVSGSTATASITSNRGLLGIFNAYSIQQIGTGTTANIDILVRLNQGGNDNNSTGPSWRVADINNNYRCVMFAATAYLQYFSSGVKNTITTAAISGFTNSTDWWMRVHHIGNHIQVRVWQDGTGEPGTWNIDTTDSHITAAGTYGLVSDLSGGAGSGSSKYDHLTVTDGSSATHLFICDGYGGVFS